MKHRSGGGASASARRRKSQGRILLLGLRLRRGARGWRLRERLEADAEAAALLELLNEHDLRAQPQRVTRSHERKRHK